MSNPFYYRGVVDTFENFYGRNEEINKILLHIKQKQSCSIVGEKKIGVSSLLYFLSNPKSLSLYGLPTDNLIIISISLEGLKFLTISDVLKMMLKEIQKSFNDDNISEKLKNNIDVKIDDVKNILNIISSKGFTHFILVDEFDAIEDNPQISSNIISFIEDIIDTMDAVFVFGSKRNIKELFQKLKIQDGKKLRELPIISIKLLTQQKVHEFLTYSLKDNNIKFDDNDIQFLYRVSGYHPYYVQISAFHLFERKLIQSTLSDNDYKFVEDNIKKELSNHFEYLWEHLNDREKSTLKKVLDKKITDWDIPDLERLVDRAMLYQDGNEYEINSSVWRDFLIDKLTFVRVEDTERVKTDELEIQQKAKKYQRCILTIFTTANNELLLWLAGVVTLFTEDPMPLKLSSEMYAERITNAYFSQNWRFEVKNIGKDIYNELFNKHPTVLSNYSFLLGSVKNTSDISLRFVGERDSLQIPFELLFDGKEYLALKHPIVRYIKDIPIKKFALSEELITALKASNTPLRIMLISSNTEPPIPSVDSEIQTIYQLLDAELSDTNLKYEIKVVPTESATFDNITNLLKDTNYHIIHYAGHSFYDRNRSEESSLFFWEKPNRQGKILEMKAYEIKSLLQNSDVRFIYLSCCLGAETGSEKALTDNDFLGITDSIIQAGVPSVMGFRWRVSDEGAKRFAWTFYSSLVKDWSLSNAILEARTETMRKNRDDKTWASPVIVVQK